jgi:RecB family exonuclease
MNNNGTNQLQISTMEAYMATYSYSSLTTFEQCPLKYRFIYIDRIWSDRESIEAFLGKRAHEVLKVLYSDYRYRPPSKREILRIYHRLWDEKWHDGVFITKQDRTAEDYRGLGHRCIEDYYERYAPFNQSEVIALEHAILARLDSKGNYWLRGIIDRLCQGLAGVYEIHDYKTSERLLEPEEVEEDRC